MLIESSKPLLVKLRSGSIRMQPGHPVEFSDEDGSKLLARVPGKVRVICQTGSPISWQRGDGSHQTAIVDFIHVDADGQAWAFVDLPGGQWAAVSLKHATVLA